MLVDLDLVCYWREVLFICHIANMGRRKKLFSRVLKTVIRVISCSGGTSSGLRSNSRRESEVRVRDQL